jgi:hypothetical protein
MQVSSAQAYQAAQGLTMGCIQVGILNTILLAGRGHLDRHVNVLQAQGGSRQSFVSPARAGVAVEARRRPPSRR